MLRWVEQVRRIGESNIRAGEVAAVRNGLVRAGEVELDRALESLPVAHLPATNEVRIGAVRGAELVPDFRAGNINDALLKSGSSTRVTPSVEFAAKRVFARSIPEVEIDQVERVAQRIKAANPDLNIQLQSAAEYERLPASTRQKIERAMDSETTWRNGKRAVYAFTVLAGGAILAEVLSKAVRERNGCWAIQTIDGKSTYCKLTKRSCGQTEGDNTCGPNAIVPTAGNLFVLVASAYSNPTLKATIETATGAPISFDAIAAYVQAHLDKLEPLLVGHNFDRDPDPCIDPVSKQPYAAGCVMCNPSATLSSREYLDTKTMPSNLTYRCIRGSTVGDVFGDIGSKSLQVVSSVFSGVVNFLWFGLGALLLVVLIAFGLRSGGSNATVAVPVSPQRVWDRSEGVQ